MIQVRNEVKKKPNKDREKGQMLQILRNQNHLNQREEFYNYSQ